MGNIYQNNKTIKSVLFVTPYPDGSAPSQRFRIELFYNKLSEENIHFETRSFWNDQGIKALYKEKNYILKFLFFLYGCLRRFYHLFFSLKFDIVIVHREVLPVGSPIWIWIVKNIFKRKVIYDFDDAIWIPHHSENHRFMKIVRLMNQTKWQIKFSNVVYAGNSFLKNYALQFNKNTVLIPTVVDTNYHSPKNHIKNKTLTIGWTGSHSTLSYLKIIWPTIKKLNEKYTFRFLIICNAQPEFEENFVEYIHWSKEQEIEQLSAIDIGVMPMPEEEWAKGKCAFKAIQYMALDKPVVATSFGANKAVVEHESCGFLVQKNHPEEWFGYLEKLLQSEQLRIEIGKNGRKRVEKHYSLQAISQDFIKNITHDDKALPSK